MNTLMKYASTTLLVGFAATGCTTMGTGQGSSRTNDVRASFMWKGTGDRTGTLNASLSTGETFSGQFFQITSESRIDQLGPLWTGWNNRWGGWRYWNRDPGPAFVTHYSGRVVANLEGPEGQHMRCHFQLITPTSGMAGGGQGQCQLPSGKTIDTTFAKS